MVQGAGCMVEGGGCRVQGGGCKVEGAGSTFKVKAKNVVQSNNRLHDTSTLT